MVYSSLYILTILLAAAALAEYLAQKPGCRQMGGALLVILIMAVLANLGVVPTISDDPPIYEAMLNVGAPVSIFLILLNVHLTALRSAGGPMLAAFGLGVVGTVIGVTAAGWVTGADQWLGEFNAPLQGAFVGTYIGGSANFNAVALHFDIMRNGNLFAAANAVDSIFTAVWMAALLILPALLRARFKLKPAPLADNEDQSDAMRQHSSRPSLMSLSILLSLAFAGHLLSIQLAAWFAGHGFAIPPILILTTFALALAQWSWVRKQPGAQMLGTYGAYLFLGVIGAFCDLGALAELGQLGLQLMLFVTLAVAIHGLVIFGPGMWMRLQPEVLAVASTANIGGTLTVMPLARHLKRTDLILPGILVGSLGNGVGTYLGFLMVRFVS